MVTTPTTVSRSNMRGLVDQIERLQSEKALLNDEIMTLRSSTATNCLAEFEMLRNLNAVLEKDKLNLQKEIDNLRLSSVRFCCAINLAATKSQVTLKSYDESHKLN